MQVVKTLGFSEKAKEGKLTADEQKQIFAEYQKTFETSFQSDKEANLDDETTVDFVLSNEEVTEISALLSEEGKKNPPATGREANAALAKELEAKEKKIEQLAATEEPIVKTVIPASDAAAGNLMSIVMGHTPHSATHLFGIDSPFMARSNWWNKITADRKEVEVSTLDDSEKKAFQSAFNSYSKSLAARANFLHRSNSLAMLDFNKLAAGMAPNVSYSELDANFGEYTVRRQDILLAYFRSLPSVASIFPVQSGVRNKETVPTVQFGELSQGYRKGRIFKGNVKFSSEVYWVTDVMFKYEFDDLIALQKRYVMELSKGSSPFQWTFIEWAIAYFGRQLFNEQQRRRVMGTFVPQQSVVANPATLAADGVLRAIERAEEEFKCLPFKDLGIYTEETILEYIETMFGYVDDILPSIEGLRLYANKKHRKWYLQAYRAKYALQQDFTGSKENVQDLSPENIIWVDNMPSNCYKMWMTYEGNVENLEYVPNEMMAFKFMEDFESVNVHSRWMEGSVVQMVGVKYANEAEQIAAKRKNQWLFTNFPVTELAADATTADGSVNTVFITKANLGETAPAITNITNASEERVYKIICGSTTKPTTIAKSGNFSKISDAWVPTAVGDYIKLYLELEDYDVTVDNQTFKATRPTGKFLELERRVTS
ncbi:hypothetical protein MASR1M31_03450 [Porphyromonadaceae bacterium]